MSIPTRSSTARSGRGVFDKPDGGKTNGAAPPKSLTPVPSPTPSHRPGEGNPTGALLLFSLFSGCGGWEGAGEEGRGDEGLSPSSPGGRGGGWEKRAGVMRAQRLSQQSDKSTHLLPPCARN